MAHPKMDGHPLRSQAEVDSLNEAAFLPARRPFGVTLFLWLVLSLSAWGLLRLLAALRWWDVLNKFEARLSPLYLSITGVGWAVAGVVLLWSIWSVQRWAYLALPIAIVLWLAEYWIERTFFQAQRSNLVFTIITSILLLAVTLISAFNRSTKKFLTKSEEHEQPEEHSASA